MVSCVHGSRLRFDADCSATGLESNTDKVYVLKACRSLNRFGRLYPSYKRRRVENDSVSAVFNFVVDLCDRRLPLGSCQFSWFSIVTDIWRQRIGSAASGAWLLSANSLRPCGVTARSTNVQVKSRQKVSPLFTDTKKGRTGIAPTYL